MPPKVNRKRRKAPRLSPLRKGAKTRPAPRKPAAAGVVLDGMANAPAPAQAVPAPPEPAAAGVDLEGMANAPVAPLPAPTKLASAAPPPAPAVGRAVDKRSAEASTSGSEEEDDDDSDADAGSPPPAKTAGGKGTMAMLQESRDDRIKGYKSKMAEAEKSFYHSQKEFNNAQNALMKECPGKKRRRLRLLAANPKTKTRMTLAQKRESLATSEARRLKRDGVEFGPMYHARGGMDANGGSASNGMGSAPCRG